MTVEKSDASRVIDGRIDISRDFNRYHANGVYGGINPAGNLEMYLTEDIVPFPKRFTITSDMESQSQTERLAAGEPTRLVHAAVTFPLRSVPSIVQWLNAKLAEAKELGLVDEPVTPLEISGGDPE